jgi:signal transduction histidine kinase
LNILHPPFHERPLPTACYTCKSFPNVAHVVKGLVHDLNVALQTMRNTYEILGSDAPPDGPREIARQQGHRAVERAARLLDRLGSLTGREWPEIRRHSLQEILTDLPICISPLLPKEVQCEIQPLADQYDVLLSRIELEAVLLNVIINARDALPAGGKIDIGVREAGVDELSERGLRAHEYVVILVRDSGVGMSAEVLARAHEPYFTTKAEGKGSGLGLALAQEFAVRSGGALQITSRQGEGTLIELFLPRAGVL